MAAPPDPPDADIWPDCSVLNESLQPWRREERGGRGKERNNTELERAGKKYTGMKAESKAKPAVVE